MPVRLPTAQEMLLTPPDRQETVLNARGVASAAAPATLESPVVSEPSNGLDRHRRARSLIRRLGRRAAYRAIEAEDSSGVARQVVAGCL